MFLYLKMILTKIGLINFRNYKKLHLKLSPGINIFVGNNAQGKTNILESIYLLALTKSHRFGIENTLIKIGEETAKITGTVKENKIFRDLEIQLTKQQKKVLVNHTEIRRIADYITNLNVIIFTPDDLDIIKGAPQIRRNILNIEMSQLSRNYIQIYNEYSKILKNRNEYLRMMYINHLSDENYLSILEEKLIERAIQIYQFRRSFLERINKKIGIIFENITGLSDLSIHYEPNLDLKNYTDEEIRFQLISKFKSNRDREISQGTTLYGPHRDDFSFYLGDENMRLFSSQGQQRLAIICFKLSEIEIFKEDTNSFPILLLDDIFSEIDRKKKNKLLKYIERDIQTIITTTDLKDIKKSILEDAKIFDVCDGNVTERME